MLIRNNDLYRLNLAASTGILLLILLFCTFSAYLLLLLLLIPLFLIRHQGVELDFQGMRYRKYTAFGRSVKGEWKPISPGYQLVVLYKTGRRQMIHPLTLLPEDSSLDKYHELYLMDTTHTKRLFLHSGKNAAITGKIIRQITESSPLRQARYNPKTRR